MTGGAFDVRRWLLILALLIVWPVRDARAQRGGTTDPFRARRDSAMSRLGHDVLIVGSAVRPNDSGLRQAPDFFYFTGLDSFLGGVLVIDGGTRAVTLYHPRTLPGFAGRVSAMPPGRLDTAGVGASGLGRLLPWNELLGYLDRRLSVNPAPAVYLDVFDDVWPTVGSPLDSLPDGVARRWQQQFAERWPNVVLHDGAAIAYALRGVKDGGEVRTLRRVGRASAAALLAGMRSIRPGVRQRVAEGAVVAACTSEGGEGPSFWPWVMSGKNAIRPRPWKSSVDYHHLDRAMAAGDLVRVDIGCEVAHYRGDVGRTVPAAGTFDAPQRETWELLIAGYRAGLRAIRNGVTAEDVFAASAREVQRRRSGLRTALARRAADTLLAGGTRIWMLHGVGLEDSEPLADTLRTGSVVAFEPSFAVDGQAFYLEDMIVVTPSGYELLTPGLPSTADEIERAMRGGTPGRR